MPKTIYPTVFRLQFVRGLDDTDEPFRDYCARFGVSHETGYDWLTRFGTQGQAGLLPRSSAPLSCPHATSRDIEALVIAGRKAHPSWGPRKLKAWLEDRQGATGLPAPSTMGGILRRAGMVLPRRRRRHAWPSSRPFAPATAPNNVWTVDFKGQFHTRDGLLCYPLTLVDAFSRYLLRCDGYLHPTYEVAHRSLEAAFREHGLPTVIHSDNGSPFASTAPGGLSRLSVWWVHLGILPERGRPARPGDNGRHERMHRTLKADATDPVRANLLAQQRAFRQFQTEYNHERPHEALGDQPPARFFAPSPRPYPRRLPDIEYTAQLELRRVNSSGHFKWRGTYIFVSEVVIGEVLGLLQVDDGIWEVYLGPVRLGTVSDARTDLGLVRPPKA